MAGPINLARAPLLFALFAVICGCQTSSAQEDVPALIAHPTAQTRAELLRALTEALDGATVTIADDALTRENLLIIERKPHRDLRGRPLSGRDLGRPEPFRLVRSGSQCFLVRERTGERWLLQKTTCAPAAKAPPRGR